MSDHININAPQEKERAWKNMEEIALLKTQLEIANKRIISLENDLDSIFTRAYRGDEIWLCSGDSKVIVRPVENLE